MTQEWKRTRIWNDSDRDWIELFNGDKLTIPAGGYVEMSRHDATRFCGQWFDPVDKDTKEITHLKKLRREPILIDTADPLSGLSKTMCIVCRRECGTKMALEKHMRAAHPSAFPMKEEKKDDESSVSDSSTETL